MLPSNASEIERRQDIRYGWYLRPSYAMSRDQAEMHDLLRRQFGLRGGGVFMPHATIKGFFRSDASVAEIVAAFDRAVQGKGPFTIYNAGPIPFGRTSIVLDIDGTPEGTQNVSLRAIHDAGWATIGPLVHPECNFTGHEPAEDRFHAHLTLAMADLRPEFYDEVHAFIMDAAPIGPPTFEARYFHLFAFHSEDWGGRWWESLTWSLLHGWDLGKI